jgi:hypothetical protein
MGQTINEKLKARNHSEDLSESGKLILKWILRKEGNHVSWIHLARERGQ